MNITTRLILVVFVSVLAPILLLTYYLRMELSAGILREKEDKLYGLARQLDNYIDGTFDDILSEHDMMNAPWEEKIRILNEELREITDFVAYGNPGVGVGYYNRKLDAIITYGPSDTFQYTVGQSIFEGHQGYEVMASGQPMVQTGELVRGNIMNCMWPMNREGQTIGYIWSNETVDMVDKQLSPIQNRIYAFILVCFLAICISVVLTTRRLPERIMRIQGGIEKLFVDPNYRLPEVGGELDTIVSTINELVSRVSFMKSYNKYIIEGIINGLIVVSVDGTITRTNQAFSAIFPDLPRPLLDHDYREILEPQVATIIQKGLEQGQLVTNEEVQVGGKILEVYSNNIIDETSEVLGMVVVFRDVTLIKNYERELAEKERIAALGEMALGVVHEVKNPLTSVKGFTQLLRRRGLDPTKREGYLDIIDADLNRVNRILNEMLTYGGRNHMELVAEDIRRILQEAADMIRAEYPDLPLRLALPKAGSFRVRIDRFKMFQVIDNIVKNAIDAMKETEKKNFVILLRCSGSAIRLDFIDHGSGIQTERLEKIFDPFYTTKQEGTGFGLPICYKIIEGHGGTIQVSSRYGFYTRVRIDLPGVAEELGLS